MCHSQKVVFSITKLFCLCFCFVPLNEVMFIYFVLFLYEYCYSSILCFLLFLLLMCVQLFSFFLFVFRLFSFCLSLKHFSIVCAFLQFVCLSVLRYFLYLISFVIWDISDVFWDTIQRFRLFVVNCIFAAIEHLTVKGENALSKKVTFNNYLVSYKN